MKTSKKPDYILDTNVIIDLYDISNFDNLANFEMRKKRAFEAIQLACYLNNNKSITLSLKGEFLSFLIKKDKEHTDNLLYHTFYAHLREKIFPEWSFCYSDSVENVKSNQADDKLIELAKIFNIPLISNELAKIPQKCHDADVDCYTTEEFLKKKNFLFDDENFKYRLKDAINSYSKDKSHSIKNNLEFFLKMNENIISS